MSRVKAILRARPAGPRRLALAALLAALASLAALVAVVVPALAAGPPALTTGAAEEVGITTVKISGTVNPEGSSGEPANTTWYLQVSPVGQEAWAGGPGPTIEGTAAEESNPVAVSQVLGGAGELSGGTEYEYRLYAEGPGGASETPHPYPTFTTEGATAPTLTLTAASEVAYTSAHLSGTVDPEGGNTDPGASEPLPIHWFLQYEPTSEPGNWQGAGSGTIKGPEAGSNTAIPVGAPLSGLHPNTSFTARLLVEYAGALDVTAAEEPTFTTKAVATPSVTIAGPGAVTATTAHLSGTIDPNAPEADPTSPAVEAGFEVHWHFQCTPECPGAEGAPVAADDTAHSVEATATSLVPGVDYEVTLLAENAGGEETRATSISAAFTTEAAPPVVSAPSVTGVGSTAATVHAEVNPRGATTTYIFEYGPTEGYGRTTAVYGPIAAGDPAQPVSAQLIDLEPAATYHYRLVATNAVEATRGVDATFHTFPAPATGVDSCPNAALRTGPSALLPDCRAFEMLTPTENLGADVYVPYAVAEGILNPGRGGTPTKLPFQVAADGEAIAYVGDPTVGGNGFAGSGEGVQYVANRDPSGSWSQSNIQPGGGNRTAFYAGFSEQLSLGIVSSGGWERPEQLPLSTSAPGGGYPILYIHAPTSSIFQPLLTTAPPEPAREFRTYGVPEILGRIGRNYVAYGGASADQSQQLFEAKGILAPGALNVPEANNLYDAHAGQISLVNVLPDGVSEANATFGGPRLPSGNEEDGPDFDHVIAADGSAIYWTDLNTGVIYLRQNPAGSTGEECINPADACTVRVSGPGQAEYWAATVDGRYAYYTEEEALWRYNSQSESREELSAGGVQGVAGAAEDGTAVYFVSTATLATNDNSNDATAEAGQDNLYLLGNSGAPHFVATLSGKDNRRAIEVAGTNGQTGDWQPGLGHRTVEVTPKGGSLVFESNNQRVDGQIPQVAGTPLEEVYLYSATDDQLSCVSCDPADEPPQANRESNRGIGGFLPPSWSFTYRPRWMSDSGDRVFFDSSQPLVPADTNETQDVYEWEQEGSGSCHDGEGGEGGCVFLLSGHTVSPPAEAGSSLIGIDSEGDNAFIVSRNNLTHEVSNEAFNLFDARIEGGHNLPPTSCEPDGCAASAVPAPPTFPGPGSSTFQGSEESIHHVGKRPKCSKGAVRAHGHCVKRGHPSRHRRRPGRRHDRSKQGDK